MRYAEKTNVPVENSQAELARLLKRHHATQHAFASDAEHGTAAVAFRIDGRHVRFELSLVSVAEFSDRAVSDPPHGWKSWSAAKRHAWCERQADQTERQRWRALVLVTKAKLELVAEGLSTIEREFLADIVLPNGSRVGEWLAPQLEAAYSSKKMPPLLTEGRRG